MVTICPNQGAGRFDAAVSPARVKLPLIAPVLAASMVTVVLLRAGALMATVLVKPVALGLVMRTGCVKESVRPPSEKIRGIIYLTHLVSVAS